MRYDVLLCDADNTLFDFNKAEENAFAIACEEMGFSSTPELLATYSAINEALWKLLEQGKIEQSVLRVRRFEQFLAAIHRDGDAQRMCDAFVEALGRQSVPLDGAVEAVRRWSAKIPVVIVTNGIAQVQRGRMAKSELRPYISGLVISEEVGAAKPNPLMLEKGMWGDEAYIDLGSGMLFKSQEAATAYFDAAHRAKAEQEQPAQAAPAPEGYAAILAQIRDLNDRIADERLSAQMDRMEQVAGRIFRLIEEDENKRAAAGTFLSYYLPTTLKLLENYAAFEEAGVSGENLSQAKAKIEKTMDSIVAGFEHQLDELYRTDAMDIDSDIRVMETMLRRDTASVADDFGLNGGSAVQQKEP